jgi:hypothetical protein
MKPEAETRSGPTDFQLNFFVIGKEPTIQAKMHKCLQEIKERKNAILNVELEIEETNDVNALLSLDLNKMDKMKAEEREIRQRQIKRKMRANDRHIENLQTKITSWKAEINFLQHLFNQMEELVPLKNWTDFDVQLEYWSEKMAQEIKSRLLMNAPIDMEVIKTAMALPDQSPVKKQLLEHVQTKEKELSK